ncbi:uncharacterized protein TNCV_2696451 [Trichonephila clavipes]|nr:uncharacterized protein TNCV_2696451 [Trichonephila clavipes]
MDVPLKKLHSERDQRRKDLKETCIGRNLCLKKKYYFFLKNVSPNKSSSAKKLPSAHKISEAYENDVSVEFQVNGDGTWKTRGHTSLIGVCALIGADCGKVLDMEVMSSYCKGCDSDKGPKLGPKYSAFLAKHHIFCRKNHSRSAGKMEVCGMQKTFLRSEQKHGLKYQRYIGDGDSKTFLSIAEKEPYENSVPIVKIECGGHV